MGILDRLIGAAVRSANVTLYRVDIRFYFDANIEEDFRQGQIIPHIAYTDWNDLHTVAESSGLPPNDRLFGLAWIRAHVAALYYGSMLTILGPNPNLQSALRNAAVQFANLAYSSSPPGVEDAGWFPVLKFLESSFPDFAFTNDQAISFHFSDNSPFRYIFPRGREGGVREPDQLYSVSVHGDWGDRDNPPRLYDRRNLYLDSVEVLGPAAVFSILASNQDFCTTSKLLNLDAHMILAMEQYYQRHQHPSEAGSSTPAIAYASEVLVEWLSRAD